MLPLFCCTLTTFKIISALWGVTNLSTQAWLHFYEQHITHLNRCFEGKWPNDVFITTKLFHSSLTSVHHFHARIYSWSSHPPTPISCLMTQQCYAVKSQPAYKRHLMTYPKLSFSTIDCFYMSVLSFFVALNCVPSHIFVLCRILLTANDATMRKTGPTAPLSPYNVKACIFKVKTLTGKICLGCIVKVFIISFKGHTVSL